MLVIVLQAQRLTLPPQYITALVKLYTQVGRVLDTHQELMEAITYITALEYQLELAAVGE